MSNARRSRATLATLLLSGIAVLIIGLLMVLWAPPYCPPVSAIAGPETCRPSWPVPVGGGMMLLAGALLLWLLLDAVVRRGMDR